MKIRELMEPTPAEVVAKARLEAQKKLAGLYEMEEGLIKFLADNKITTAQLKEALEKGELK